MTTSLLCHMGGCSVNVTDLSKLGSFCSLVSTHSAQYVKRVQNTRVKTFDFNYEFAYKFLKKFKK